MELVRHLSQRADHLGVAGVTNQNEIVSLCIVPIHLVMHFNDQGTGRIDDVEPAAVRLFPYRFGDAMGAEDDDRTLRDLVQFFDEDCALVAQRIDDVSAVDDFMADKDRRSVFLQRQIDDIDRPIDPGAKAAWIGEIDLHRSPSLILNICSPYVSRRASVNRIAPDYSAFQSKPVEKKTRASNPRPAAQRRSGTSRRGPSGRLGD